MGYYYTTSPEKAVPGKSDATPKTHTPGSPVKERGARYYMLESGRWASRDPLISEPFSCVSQSQRYASKAEAEEQIQESDQVLENATLLSYTFCDNDVLDHVDAVGLLIDWFDDWGGDTPKEFWKIVADPDGYTACYAKCMLWGTSAKGGWELGGGVYVAKKYYTWKYPKWFKAGGKYSKKLVPKFVKKVGGGFAVFGAYEAWKCYQECKCKLGGSSL